MRIEIETPQNIYDTQTAEYTPGTVVNRDVFLEVAKSEMTGSEYNYNDIIDSLWSRYRFRMLASCDTEYWLTCLKDSFSRIYKRYAPVFAAYKDADQSDLADEMTTSEGSDTYEELPDTATTATMYATNRTKNGQTVKHYGGLNAATLEDLRKNARNVYDMFAAEFETHFLPLVG